jgi:anaerobic magnesium-protoporphyrin IX monomethyl ester cyclase
MRFLFINPNRSIVKSNIWSVVNSVMPPLGLATLAAILEREGVEADIIDALALNLDESGLVRVLAGRAPYDYVGLTATTPEINNAIDVSRLVRTIFPGAEIIFGGVHATIFHEELIRNRVCDLAVRGEGESVVLALAQKQQRSAISNLSWRDDNGSIIINPDATTYVDLNDLPLPAYHKLPMHRYRSALGAAQRFPSIGMSTSRGCPGSCTFCFSGMFGKKIRFLSAEKMLEHVALLQKDYGIREISFYDDTFTANRKRVEDFCKGLIERDMRLSWSCFARIDTVNPGLLQLMRSAGCHQIMYGFEAADDAVLAAINKKVVSSSYSQVVAWTNQAGINIRGAFMLGSPGEDAAGMRRTINFSKELGVSFAIYNITTPYPGTELYRWAKEQGFLKHTDWQLYDLAHPVLELPGLSSDTVTEYYHRAYREFYLRPSYILRRLISLFSLAEIRMYREAFTGILSMTMGKRADTITPQQGAGKD